MDINTISANIRRIRLVKGLSQENVANALHVSRLTYGELERGHKDISIKQLEEIAKVLETDIAILFDFPERAIFNQTNNEQAFAGYKTKHEHRDEGLIAHLKEEVISLRTQNSRLLDMLNRDKA